MSTIFKYLRDAAGKGNKAGGLILLVVKSGDYSDLITAAKDIDTAYPVDKVDGKDVNRAARNNLLSMLRMQMRRASATAELAGVLSIKNVKGEWLVRLVTKEQATEQAATDEATGQDDATVGRVADTDEAGLDALWSAAELVLSNLDNPAIMLAIRKALEDRANSVKS